MRVLVAIVVERLGWRVLLCFVDVGKRVIRIHDYIHPRIDLFVWPGVENQGVRLNGLPDVNKHGELILRGSWAEVFITGK